MELITLEYFCSIASGLTFEETAAKFHISTSSLSKIIKNMESEFGFSLFDRSRRSVKLTSAGNEFYHGIVPILSQYNELIYQVSRFGLSHKIKCRAYTSFSDANIYPIIEDFFKDNPDLLFVPSSSNSIIKTLEELRCKSIDFVIMNAPINDTSEFQTTPLRNDMIVVCCKSTHPYASLGTLKFNDIVDETILVTHDSFPIVLELGKYFGVPLKNKSVRLCNADFLSFLGDTSNISLFYASQLYSLKLKNVAVIPISDIKPQPYVLTWRKEDTLLPFQELFVDYLSSRCRESGYNCFIDKLFPDAANSEADS